MIGNRIFCVAGAMLYTLLTVSLWMVIGGFLILLWLTGSVFFLLTVVAIYVSLRRLKWSSTTFFEKLHRRIKYAVVAFVCGVNGFLVSLGLIGMATCDCCEREHPNAVHTYPFLDSNKTVSKILNNVKVCSMLAWFLLILNIASMGLTTLSIFYGTLYACACVMMVFEKLRGKTLSQSTI